MRRPRRAANFDGGAERGHFTLQRRFIVFTRLLLRGTNLVDSLGETHGLNRLEQVIEGVSVKGADGVLIECGCKDDQRRMPQLSNDVERV